MPLSLFFFLFNDTATTEIYTLSLHDALPICGAVGGRDADPDDRRDARRDGAQARRAHRHVHGRGQRGADRKSTRLNSSHLVISYAVFCLKKKNKTATRHIVLRALSHSAAHDD